MTDKNEIIVVNDGKKKRKTIDAVISDNRFVFAVSLILALTVWFFVSMYASPSVTRTVYDVPVNINYEDSTPANLGLVMFGDTNFKVDVTVSGPQYKVSESALKVSDINVTANTSYVNTAGLAVLDLRATVSDATGDISVLSLSQSNINVYFDTQKSAEFTLVPDILASGDSYAADGYMTDTPVLSISRVLITGAAKELDKIDKVVARASLDSRLTSTTTLDAQIVPVDTDGTRFRYLTLENEEVTVTLPVRKIIDLPVSVNFTSAPADYSSSPISYTVSPSSVSCGVLSKDIDTITALTAGTIDFSEIGAGITRFSFDAAGVSDVMILDDVDEFNVSVNASEMTSNEYEITLTQENTSLINVPEDLRVSPVTGSVFTVRAIGTESDLAALDSSGIYIEANLAGIDLSRGRNTVTAHAVVKSNTSCWIYGIIQIEVEVS